jgi:thiamine kinase-like enzyme
VSLEACLPADLRVPTTTITAIAGGLSGAGVYRVDAAGQAFVLKVGNEHEPLVGWRSRLHIQQLAANAGLAPRVVHADETRRAVVSAFVADRSFPAFYAQPHTHETALSLLGRTLRRIHELALPADAESRDLRQLLAATWSRLSADFTLPTFAAEAVHRVLADEPPACARRAVLSHNDVNPTNLVYDGERLLLLDWDTAGSNDPFYDLAAIAVFLRMDDRTCLKLLAAYDGEPVAQLPDRFLYDRRFVAALCGTMFLQLACHRGCSSGDQTLASVLSLAELYQRLRAGSLDVRTAEGQWSFGLALLKETFAS